MDYIVKKKNENQKAGDTVSLNYSSPHPPERLVLVGST
jgi:hypothetical protein